MRVDPITYSEIMYDEFGRTTTRERICVAKEITKTDGDIQTIAYFIMVQGGEPMFLDTRNNTAKLARVKKNVFDAYVKYLSEQKRHYWKATRDLYRA